MTQFVCYRCGELFDFEIAIIRHTPYVEINCPECYHKPNIVQKLVNKIRGRK